MTDDFVFCSSQLEQDRNRIFFAETVPGVLEWPHSWPDGELSYRLNNISPDFPGRQQIRAVTVALRAWQLRVSRIKFRRERNPTAHVDFNVSFESKDKFASDHVLAHAWFPGQGDISGDVEINDESWDWVPSAYFQDLAHPPLTAIMMHEFGHGLGLRHDTTNMDSMLYPSFNLGRTKNSFHANDIHRIQERYGARNLSQRWLDYFARRRLSDADFN